MSGWFISTLRFRTTNALNLAVSHTLTNHHIYERKLYFSRLLRQQRINIQNKPMIRVEIIQNKGDLVHCLSVFFSIPTGVICLKRKWQFLQSHGENTVFVAYGVLFEDWSLDVLEQVWYCLIQFYSLKVSVTFSSHKRLTTVTLSFCHLNGGKVVFHKGTQHVHINLIQKNLTPFDHFHSTNVILI